MKDLGELVVVDDGEGQHDLSAVRRRDLQEIALGPDHGGERGHDLLADGIQRRVGDLGEGLLEVVEEQPRTRRQGGHGGVGAHGADRLRAADRHRRQDEAELLLGVAEGLLTPRHGRGGVHDVLTIGQQV